MAERVLSIEIGYSLTKVCEIEKGAKTPKILNSFVIDTPPGVIADGFVTPSDEFTGSFKSMMSAKRIRTRKAIFTIASARIVSKDTTIPFVKDSKVKDVVRAGLADYFPVSVDKYMFAHSITGVIKDASAEQEEGKGKNKAKATGYKVQVLAAPKNLIESYQDLAKAFGLELVSLDYNGNSIFQAAKEECKEGTELIVKIDETGSLLMVTDEGSVSMTRTIPYGINRALEELMTTRELGDAATYDKALELARRKRVIFSNFDGEAMATDDDDDTNQIIWEEKKKVTEAFAPLVTNIMKVIDFYNANHTENHIEKAYITGIGADFSGLSKLINHELDVKVKNLTHLSGIDASKIFADATFGEYVSVIGAAIAPLDFYPDHDEKVQKKKSALMSSTILAAFVMLLGLIAAVVLAVMAYFPNQVEKSLNQKYNNIINELQPSYDIYLDYQKAEEDIQFLRTLDNATKNRNSELMQFVKYMEEEMPYTFCLNSMEADYDHVVIDAIVGSKEEVAFVYSKLQDFEAFTAVTIDSVSQIENELGEIMYGFTVDMYYAPIVDSEETEVEGN